MIESENFIRHYPDVLDDGLISALIDLIDNEDDKKICTEKGVFDRSYISYGNNKFDRKDTQILLEPFWPTNANEIHTSMIDKCLTSYIKDFPFLGSIVDWVSSSTLLQQTKPMQGFHAFHAENASWPNKDKTLAWMIYLNDVDEGGETEFLYQRLRFKPKKNCAIIWPGSFTHLHRGNPPISGNKYILTGWYSSMKDMRTFSLKPEK